MKSKKTADIMSAVFLLSDSRFVRLRYHLSFALAYYLNFVCYDCRLFLCVLSFYIPAFTVVKTLRLQQILFHNGHVCMCNNNWKII